MSTNNFGGQDTDFREHPVGFDPLHIVMTLCESCGYSDHGNYFINHRQLDDATKRRIRETLTPTPEMEIKSSLKYVYAARIATWRGAPFKEIANLYLRAAWCCADEDDRENETTYRLAAIEHLEQSLARNEYGSSEIPVIIYLIGELYRRIHKVDEARIWFDKVLALDDLDASLGWVKTVAQQQRDNPEERWR